MSKKLEDILKERFEHFEAEADGALFDRIVQTRKRRALLIWWQKGRWVAAAILLVVLTKFAWEQVGQSDVPVDAVKVETTADGEFNTNPEADVQSYTESQLGALDQSVELNAHEGTNETAGLTESNESIIAVESMDNPSTNQERGAEQNQSTASPESEEPRNQPEESDANLPIDIDIDALAQDLPLDAVEEVPQVAEAVEDEAEQEIVFDDIEGSIEPNTVPSNDDPIGPKFYPSPWSMEFSAGPGYAFRSLSGNQQMVDWRNETESPALSYQANLAVVRELGKNWSFRTGIMFSQRQENFQYEQWSNTNTYTSIALPLEMNNQFYRKKNFSLSARLGMMVRVKEFKDGLVRVGENDIEPISALNVESSGLIALNFGMGVSYRLNPRVELLAQPQWTHTSSGTFNDRNDLAQRDYGFFTRLGLRVNL